MIKAYIIFGILGWLMEILWTGFNSLLKKDLKLISNTSIWMFFIYGMASFMAPICKMIAPFPVIIRGGVYVVCIFAAEFIFGSLLKRINICPWDYSKYKYNIKGVIRLDYAPVWFVAGLIFETVYKYIVAFF